MLHIAGDRLSVDVDTKTMNSTWLSDGVNSTLKPVTNGSITDGITSEEDSREDEDAWYNFDVQGKTYMTCILIIVSLGLVGNTMSFILMMDRKLSSFAGSVYIKWLAVSDSVLLIMVSTEDTLDTYGYLEYFSSYNVNLCKAWHFIKSMTFILSPWLVVALTLDRFLCVLFPLSRHVLSTRSKAMILCATLTLVTVALNIYPVNLIQFDDDIKCEMPPLPALRYYQIFLNLVLKSTLPCVSVLVLNIITVSRIRRISSRRQQVTQKMEDKITVPLLLVSAFAFITLLPRTVTEVVEFILEMSETDYIALRLANNTWPIFNVIYLLNFALNFYILIASWPEYRMIMKQKFVRCKANKKPSSRPANISQLSFTEVSENCVTDGVSMTDFRNQ